MLNDGSCWTIIGVEVVEFTFNQGLTCIQTPVSPFPVINGLEVSLSERDFLKNIVEFFSIDFLKSVSPYLATCWHYTHQHYLNGLICSSI